MGNACMVGESFRQSFGKGLFALDPTAPFAVKAFRTVWIALAVAIVGGVISGFLAPMALYSPQDASASASFARSCVVVAVALISNLACVFLFGRMWGSLCRLCLAAVFTLIYLCTLLQQVAISTDVESAMGAVVFDAPREDCSGTVILLIVMSLAFLWSLRAWIKDPGAIRPHWKGAVLRLAFSLAIGGVLFYLITWVFVYFGTSASVWQVCDSVSQAAFPVILVFALRPVWGRSGSAVVALVLAARSGTLFADALYYMLDGFVRLGTQALSIPTVWIGSLGNLLAIVLLLYLALRWYGPDAMPSAAKSPLPPAAIERRVKLIIVVVVVLFAIATAVVLFMVDRDANRANEASRAAPGVLPPITEIKSSQKVDLEPHGFVTQMVPPKVDCGY